MTCFRREYIYELMRLGQEVTPFRTLGHIAGVHYIAMTAAVGSRRQGWMWTWPDLRGGGGP